LRDIALSVLRQIIRPKYPKSSDIKALYFLYIRRSWAHGAKKTRKIPGFDKNGGGLRIRTLGGDKPSTVFKTAAFDHSASPPEKHCLRARAQQARIIPSSFVLSSLLFAA
jgi:hypothetical protein